MRALRAQDGTAALALEFAILTARRSGETMGARWDEIDLANATWTIPPERIKARREHRVPLSPAALAIVERMKPLREAGVPFVFSGGKRGKPLFNMALLRVSETVRTMHTSSADLLHSFHDPQALS